MALDRTRVIFQEMERTYQFAPPDLAREHGHSWTRRTFMAGQGFHFDIRYCYFGHEIWQDGYTNYGVLFADVRTCPEFTRYFCTDMYIEGRSVKDNIEGARVVIESLKDQAKLYFDGGFNLLWPTPQAAYESLKLWNPQLYRRWTV